MNSQAGSTLDVSPLEVIVEDLKALSPEEAGAMNQVIEDGCENVDEAGW